MTFLWHPVRQGSPSRSTQICLSWNNGSCATTPGPCFQLHFCANCGNPHPRVKECKDTPIDIRVNERDWQLGGGRGLFIYNLYMCYVKVGKLGFCECIFSNLLALKIYIFMRGNLIKTKVMDKGHQCFLLLTIFFVSIKMLL